MINVNRLKYELKEQNKEIEDLARLLGLSVQAFYSRLKKNKFYNTEIEMLANYLNIKDEKIFLEIFFKDFVA